MARKQKVDPFDTVFRSLQMLRCVPQWPRLADSRQIQKALSREGFDISLRSIQRDLQKLSLHFPLTYEEGRPFRWQWAKHARQMSLPSVQGSAAVAFCLLERHLRPLLPESLLVQLQPHFNEAGKAVTSGSGKRTPWLDKVAVIDRGQPLLPPKLDEVVLAEVSEALLRDLRFTAIYQSRAQAEASEFEFNPLGLVLRDETLYLVGTLWGYADIRQFALHRMMDVRVSDKKSKRPDSFKLQEYVKSGAFEYPEGGMIRLKMRMQAKAAFHLEETALSEDQKLTYKGDLATITATVRDTSQLRWWIKGFGGLVEVLAPKRLREEMIEHAEALASIYEVEL